MRSASSAAFFCENFAGTVSVFAGASGTAKAPFTNAAFGCGWVRNLPTLTATHETETSVTSPARACALGLAVLLLGSTPAYAAAARELRGTPGNDVINGKNRDDRIMALGGRDVVHGNGGDDTIFAGSGGERKKPRRIRFSGSTS